MGASHTRPLPDQADRAVNHRILSSKMKETNVDLIAEREPLDKQEDHKNTDPENAGTQNEGKTDANKEEQQMLWRIIFFAILNVALLALICVTGFYLAKEQPPPEPNYKLCVKCEDIRGHPDDPMEHIIETDGTCCLDKNENLKFLVGQYASRWMKMKMHEENNTFKVCNVSRKPIEKPSIKVMGVSHVQTHEHHRLHWDHTHSMAITPAESLIKYLPHDGQIEIVKTGLYHVYCQVHFKLERGTPYNPATLGHWVYIKRAGTIEGSENVLMHNSESECEGSGSEIVTSSYLGSDFQLSEGDKLYVKVNKKDKVIPEPHLNYFGAHML